MNQWQWFPSNRDILFDVRSRTNFVLFTFLFRWRNFPPTTVFNFEHNFQLDETFRHLYDYILTLSILFLVFHSHLDRVIWVYFAEILFTSFIVKWTIMWRLSIVDYSQLCILFVHWNKLTIVLFIETFVRCKIIIQVSLCDVK